jgi:Mn-dependent DtxR family transcriptional regulator
MAEETVSADVGEFILRHIDTVAQLEALLLLWRERGIEWGADAIARRLYISEKSAVEALARLCKSGLIKQSRGAYLYEGDSEELRSQLDRVASTYSRHLIQVTQLIHTKPSRIREFANAFKFRKDS